MDWQDAMEDWSAYLREHDTEGEQALAAMDDEARREAFTLELTFGTWGLARRAGHGALPHEPVYGGKGYAGPGRGALEDKPAPKGGHCVRHPAYEPSVCLAGRAGAGGERLPGAYL